MIYRDHNMTSMALYIACMRTSPYVVNVANANTRAVADLAMVPRVPWNPPFPRSTS